MKLIQKIVVITMTMGLFSCGSTCESTKIPELNPLRKEPISKPALDCLGVDLKKVVIDRVMNCDARVKTLTGQIKAHNTE